MIGNEVRDENIDTLISFANQLADVAASVTVPYFRSQLSVENKAGPAGFDPVTAADRAAESAMRERIRERFPSHGILGEEQGTEDGDRYTWVLDPIDGTRGFMTGLPTWGTLIGLELDGAPIVGVMDQPFVGDRFIGSPRGAELRRKMPSGGESRIALRTRPCFSLDTAVLSSTSPDLFTDEAEKAAFDDLRRGARLVRYGGDCYAYCMLAAGFIDLVVENGLKPYDIVALVPIIERAGGVVTDWNGGPARMGGQIVAAGDRRLHAIALAMLHKAAR